MIVKLNLEERNQVKNETKTSHDEYLELLPWYVNESLTDKERIRVMEHLSECTTCRAERDQLQLLQENVQKEDLEVPDYRFSFSKLMKRIDANELNKVSTEELPILSNSNSLSKRLVSDGRWPLFATAASLVLGVFLLANSGLQEDSSFQTLSKTIVQSGMPHRIGLSFEDTLEPAKLRQVLSELQSTLVAGPDEKGVYTVEIYVPVDLTDAEFINIIRDTEGVKYAIYSQTHDRP